MDHSKFSSLGCQHLNPYMQPAYNTWCFFYEELFENILK